jgi:mono/diheme cytochrome c family protein
LHKGGQDRAVLPHLSELHGAATHLAVVAIPLYALVVLLRKIGTTHPSLAPIEPWVLGAALVGVAASGATGLLVWGQAQQGLRGDTFRNGSVHFWLGIALAVVVLGVVVLRYKPLQRGGHVVSAPVVAVAALAFAMVGVQGYVGGRMTYEHGVGVDRGGQFAQTATGAEQLNLALAQGVSPEQAGAKAFSTTGLGCAACHGDKAQGGRAPALAGGRELEEFRGVHGHGLFPPSVVTDEDFAAIVAFLKTQGQPAR